VYHPRAKARYRRWSMSYPARLEVSGLAVHGERHHHEETNAARISEVRNRAPQPPHRRRPAPPVAGETRSRCARA